MHKLLQINTTCNQGSTGRIAENIGVLAQNNGWDCYLAHGPRYIQPSKLKTYCIEDSINEKIHGIKSLLCDGHGLGSKSGTSKFISLLNQLKPDIIHLHNIHGYYLNYPILFNYLKTIQIPIVWTLHDCWSFTGHCVYFDFCNCKKWIQECHNCPQSKTYPKSLLDQSKRNFYLKKETFNGLKNLTIVPVSDWLERLVKQSFLKQYPTHRIYNGIDTNTFNPQKNKLDVCLKYGIPENEKIILGVANPWSSRKGLSDFIELNKILPSSYRIILVGLSNEQIKNLPNNIIGIGRTNNTTELAEIYSAANLFLNLTYEDNFPTTNLEALSCDTPVLTYNTGGSPEAITTETGFVVDQGDLAAVVNILESTKVQNKFKEGICRKYALEHFNKDDRFNDYIQLYNIILESKTNNHVSI